MTMLINIDNNILKLITYFNICSKIKRTAADYCWCIQ